MINFFLAETGGFEPSRALRHLSVFKTDPFSHLGKSPKLVELAGLEPATNRLWVGGSNQLSYSSTMVAGVRLELTTSRVWTVLSSQLRYPANTTRFYSCLLFMVGMTGFEPATPWSQTKCTTKLCYIPFMEVPVGFEPTLWRLQLQTLPLG